MWNDAKLKWNPADYGGVESIHVADHEATFSGCRRASSSRTVTLTYGGGHVTCRNVPSRWDPGPITSEWELVSLHKERHARIYPCCKEAYPDIEFTMVMKRRSPMMFYSACLALTTLALIVAVISMNLSRCPHPPPAALKRLFTGFLGKLLCVCDNQQSRSQTNKDTEAANHEQEWLNLII
ncbi:hypothetical protein B566_EDAN014263 [Ephemera danica]|nr:hypothetical protein B566_EDAN014263 [Ephemera danica]